nr:N-6 DNA methylase [Odoribacter splanchnicus]
MGKIDGIKPNGADDLVINAVRLVYSYMLSRYPDKDITDICNELRIIARIDECDFLSDTANKNVHSYTQIQEMLSKINEKESIRKSKGVYYTPNDVVRFILINSIKSLFGKLTVNNINDLDLSDIPYRSFCCTKTIFDPTCGSGEYLLTALEIKLAFLKQHKHTVSAADVKESISTLYGNDVNIDSVIITELRLLLCVAEICGIEQCYGLGNIMNRRFTIYDFVGEAIQPNMQFHIIVGNPPYVEDSKSGLLHIRKYGNIYANVLINAAKRLEKNGAMGFIIPLSYVSTPRMKLLREELAQLIPEQYILSFADRPDCLFDSVHQKLCIIIGKDKRVPLTLYTGNYQYWYKKERASLFQNIQVIKNTHQCDDYIPKLGTQMDIDIYKKITNPSGTVSIYDVSRQGNESVYLNRREAFWMKAYRAKVDDPEYKKFSFATAPEADFCYCIINSSLFWWYWIAVSDCWHVSKALNNFRMPVLPNVDGATNLATLLIDKLEATKVYVGTKQTQYEYKHRDCLEEIRAIDDFINAAYGLTETESEYIKAFAIKYRTSGGIDADESN